MAQVTIYDPSGLVQVVPGNAQVDQSALVAEQAAQIATLTGERDAAATMAQAAEASRDALAAKIAAAQAALA